MICFWRDLRWLKASHVAQVTEHSNSLRFTAYERAAPPAQAASQPAQQTPAIGGDLVLLSTLVEAKLW